MKIFTRMIMAALVITSLSNCSRIVKEEAYLSAEQTEPLKSTESMDLPNSSSQLKVPDIASDLGALEPETRPPEMAFAKRRSEDENVVIVESGGMPTIEIFNDKDAWDLMMGDHGYNWLLLDEDPQNCQATFQFYDPIIEDLADRGFLKKLFSFRSNYIDRSGEYVLTCVKLPQKQQIWLQTIDFEAPSSYVTDDLFSHIFEAATAD